MAVILRADGLAIGYPGYPVGEGLDLTIEDGTVTMLLGPNGCGKTTLFRTLLGVLPAQAGTLRIADRPFEDMSRTEMARQLAYVPQVAHGYFPFAVMDVVLMGRAPFLHAFARPGAADRKIAADALAEVGIADIAERPFSAISGGQRQLTLIARALAQSARVLILDEPTANLDYGNQHRTLARAVDLAREGRAVVISTHNPEHAFAYADRVIAMKNGGIVCAGKPGDVLDASMLSDIYEMPISVSTADLGNGRTRRIVSPV